MLGISRGVRRGALKYQSPASGIHANSAAAGGGTGTSASPFNTLAAAHTAASPGNTIRLARNSVFRETFTITKANLTVEPYGSGADPIISGGTLTTSWTNESTNIWYATGVTVEPMLVTFDGTLGQRRFYKTKMNVAGTIAPALVAARDFWWDHRNSRLYVYSTTNPATAWTAVERAHRIGPVDVQATGVTLNTIKISHHNLDDRTDGVVAGSNNPTKTGLTTQFMGDTVANYWWRSGRNDSPWNTRLSASNSTTAAQSGFNALAFQWSEWQDMGVRMVEATGSDPLFSLYYSFECWDQVATAFAARFGNSLWSRTRSTRPPARHFRPRASFSTLRPQHPASGRCPPIRNGIRLRTPAPARFNSVARLISSRRRIPTATQRSFSRTAQWSNCMRRSCWRRAAMRTRS